MRRSERWLDRMFLKTASDVEVGPLATWGGGGLFEVPCGRGDVDAEDDAEDVSFSSLSPILDLTSLSSRDGGSGESRSLRGSMLVSHSTIPVSVPRQYPSSYCTTL